MRGLPFLTGTLYLQVVDDAGNELGRYCFERRSVPEGMRAFEPEEALSCGA